MNGQRAYIISSCLVLDIKMIYKVDCFLEYIVVHLKRLTMLLNRTPELPVERLKRNFLPCKKIPTAGNGLGEKASGKGINHLGIN